MKQSICSPGWDARCGFSTGNKCECACAGERHGKDHAPGFKNSPYKLIVGIPETGQVFFKGDDVEIELSPKKSLKLVNHSPTGFSWGFHGSGPAQLSLAILLEFMHKDKALKYYQDFKREIIAKEDKDKIFSIQIGGIMEWIGLKIEAEEYEQ